LNHHTTTQALIPPVTSRDVSIDTATLELLASWRQEDANASPEQIAAAAADLREFKRKMNENRTSAGEPVLFP
jgi:hypothetical protein